MYALLMGLLHEWCGWLLLRVAAHTIADYYIFAMIARKHVP